MYREFELKGERTALISVFHAANGISVLGAQTEARRGAVVVCVDHLVLEDSDAIGPLAVIAMSVAEPLVPF